MEALLSALRPAATTPGEPFYADAWWWARAGLTAVVTFGSLYAISRGIGRL